MLFVNQTSCFFKLPEVKVDERAQVLDVVRHGAQHIVVQVEPLQTTELADFGRHFGKTVFRQICKQN
jgi:hypothetical protein